ncbi:MAG TPA: hypothetical protein VLJ44_04450 [Gaiellaceae bacterium]|nr:hypothetical protein [Gaiellaceae bacterium]
MTALGAVAATTAIAATLATAATAGGPTTIGRAQGELFGPLASNARYIVYAQPSGDDDEPVPIEELDLRTHRKTTLVAAGLPALGVGATPGWAAFVAPYGNGQALFAVRHGTTRRVVLSTSIVSPVTSDGDRLAWAEERGGRQRVLVRTMTTRHTWVAADFPRCTAGSCYRIDYVTLSDAGVTFDRGAIGTQPSFVLRRRFDGPLESTAVPGDPQPDLVPSSAGAFYFVLDRGWFRWDFTSRRPTSTDAPQPPRGQVLAVDARGVLVQTGTSCHAKLVFMSKGRTRAFLPPRAPGGSGEVCAHVTGFSIEAHRLVVGWGLLPKVSLQTHSDAGVLGILAVQPL